MNKSIYTLLLTLTCSTICIAQSNSKLTPTPPQLESPSFTTIIGSEPTVEINLGAMMLGLLSSATESKETGIAHILSNIDSIKVKVFELEHQDKIIALKSKIKTLASIKQTEGYEALAKIKEDDSLVYVLAKMDKKSFKSLSVFALDDGDELVLIDIDGTILLSQLGQLMEHFDVDLDINGLKLNNTRKKEE